MSPRQGPRRPTVTIRLSADAIAWLDAEATKAGVTRSDMIRTLLREAVDARQTRTAWKPPKKKGKP